MNADSNEIKWTSGKNFTLYRYIFISSNMFNDEIMIKYFIWFPILLKSHFSFCSVRFVCHALDFNEIIRFQTNKKMIVEIGVFHRVKYFTCFIWIVYIFVCMLGFLSPRLVYLIFHLCIWSLITHSINKENYLYS